jgi:hypothetical protein
MAKGKYGLTAADLAKFREACPKCGSARTYQVSTGLGHSGCHECGHEWGWRDGRGSSVSRARYKQLVEEERSRWDARASRTRMLERGDGDMAKVKAKGLKAKAKAKTGGKKSPAKRDSRIPKAGTVLKAKYKGKEYTAKVTATGFEYAGAVYGSISKVGSLIMGGKACNGYKLFGLCG